jgi:hypothetical protein
MATFAFSAASFALAIAERTHFSIKVEARLDENRKMAKALLTSCPRIISTTSRAFCADPRRYLALAIASIFNPLGFKVQVSNFKLSVLKPGT